MQILFSYDMPEESYVNFYKHNQVLQDTSKQEIFSTQILMEDTNTKIF